MKKLHGRTRPINICDRECAMVNGCVVGGIQCRDCGLWFCAIELNEDGVCDYCAAENEEEEVDDDGE